MDTTTGFPHRHLLGIEGLSPADITWLLDRADGYVDQNRRRDKRTALLRGRTVMNLFFEASTRTSASFELAAKRLGADTINMPVAASSVKKGESLIDTATTLNAMHPDALIIRHPDAGAAHLLSQKVQAHVINAGDGAHEHPTQALLDALTLRRRLGRIAELDVAICGDVAHSRVARSNILLLQAMGAYVRVVAPARAAGARLKDLLREGNIDISDAFDAYQRRLQLMADAGVDVTHAEFEAEFGRTLEYYTGFVFEVVVPGLERQSPVAGGGRYDTLLRQCGAEEDVPAVGAAIHTERLLAALTGDA